MKQKLKSHSLRSFVQRIKIVLLLVTFVFFSEQSIAQALPVSGSVKNTSGQPIPGVTIVVKGTMNGTVSDVEGNFLLTNVPSDATLIISFVGMKTQEIQVAGNTQINVALVEETIGLEEVVAIGYGTVKKADLTGSVATVQGEDISTKKTAVKITNALQGTMAGVTITRSNAEPGTVGTIRIRGVTTISDSDPLVIIDGIPGSLSDLNADDVASLSVLKDAASASIFGSKAAAGVIVVTTKRGKPGQMDLKYDVEYGWDQPTRIPQYVGAVQYMKMVNELVWNDKGNTGSEYPTYSQDLIENYTSLNAENPDEYPDTDWSQYIRNFSPRQMHTLSFTSGSNRCSTRGSLSYNKVESIIDDRPYENFTARVNNDVKINDMLKVIMDMQYMYSHDQRKQTTPSPTLFNLEPTQRAYWTDGRIAYVRNGVNTFARLLDGGNDDRWTHELIGKLGFEFTPLKGLKISGNFAPNFYTYKRKDHYLALEMTDWDDPDTVLGYVSSVSTTSLYEYRNDSKNFTEQLLVDYSKTFGEHSLSLFGGFEYYYEYIESLSASREQYELDNYPYLDLGPTTYDDNSGSATEYASRSFFGRLMYNYKNKYLFQANARYDGSSRFAKDYRYGLFPSCSVGWVISEEPFFKSIEPISFLKFRASYGSLGNERIGYYPYQSTIAFSDVLMYSGSEVVSNQTAYIPDYVIENISWETTETYDFGIDVNFFDSKLQLVADYYKKTTKDMLLALEIPDYIGLEDPDQNTGEMYTRGWEMEVRYKNRIGDLSYSVAANISDYKSIMGDLGGTEFTGSQVKFEGSEYNEWYGYKSDGIYQTLEDVDNSATINSSVSPGDVKYTDISGADGIPDGKISAEYDKVLLGGSLPRYEYGGNIRLDYKNFDFSLFFQGIGKQNSYLSSSMVRPIDDGAYGAQKFILGDYWSAYNTDEQNKKVRYPRLSETEGDANNYGVTSDYWLINGGYFRLKNIILGYTLPKNILGAIGVQNLRVYANLSDLFSIDNFPKGWDPECSSGYFITRSFLLGASVKF